MMLSTYVSGPVMELCLGGFNVAYMPSDLMPYSLS